MTLFQWQIGNGVLDGFNRHDFTIARERVGRKPTTSRVPTAVRLLAGFQSPVATATRRGPGDKSGYALNPKPSEAVKVFAQEQLHNPESRRLFQGQPVSQAHSEFLYALYAADARSEGGAEKAAIGGLVCKTPHDTEAQVDRTRRQIARLRVESIAKDHRTVAGEPRLGAVPFDEFVNGVTDTALSIC